MTKYKALRGSAVKGLTARSCNCPDTFRRHVKTHYFQQAFSSPEVQYLDPSLRLRLRFHSLTYLLAYLLITQLNLKPWLHAKWNYNTSSLVCVFLCSVRAPTFESLDPELHFRHAGQIRVSRSPGQGHGHRTNKKLIRRWDTRTWHRSILLPLLRLTPPMEEFPWDNLRKILHEGQRMAKVQHSEEMLPKVSIAD